MPDITVREPSEGKFTAGWQENDGWLGCEHDAHGSAYEALGCATGRLAGTSYPEDPYDQFPYSRRPRLEPGGLLPQRPYLPPVHVDASQFRPPAREQHQPRHAKDLVASLKRDTVASLEPERPGLRRQILAERLRLITADGRLNPEISQESRNCHEL